LVARVWLYARAEWCAVAMALAPALVARKMLVACVWLYARAEWCVVAMAFAPAQ